MATEIRHKGPVHGQIVKFVLSPGVILPAIITSIARPAGTVGLTYFPDQGAPAWTNGVVYDFTATLTSSWHWSEDL